MDKKSGGEKTKIKKSSNQLQTENIPTISLDLVFEKIKIFFFWKSTYHLNITIILKL